MESNIWLSKAPISESFRIIKEIATEYPKLNLDEYWVKIFRFPGFKLMNNISFTFQLTDYFKVQHFLCVIFRLIAVDDNSQILFLTV